MKNVFAETGHKPFAWENIGDIKSGRENLGEEMPIAVYRLMQYTLLDVLSQEFGIDRAYGYFRESGLLAGTEFAKNALNLKQGFESFISHLQEVLKDLKVGVLRIESADLDTGEIILTIGEDLDCSGLPVTNENVCVYDEGFIAGILNTYTNKKYNVQEIDCWASGARVCRFKCVVV